MNIIETAYERFCKERFPLPSEGELFALQRRIGVLLPSNYRQFILDFNGGCFKDPIITPVGPGCPTECLDALFGIGASRPGIELGRPADIALFDGNDPPKILPIGRTAVGGLIILETAPGDGNGSNFLKQAWGGFYYLTEDIAGFFALLQEPPRR